MSVYTQLSRGWGKHGIDSEGPALGVKTAMTQHPQSCLRENRREGDRKDFGEGTV